MVKVPGVQESECRCWNQSSTIWSLSLCLATLSILATCHSDQHLHPCISSFKQDAYNFANDPQHARAALALATLALALSTLRAVSGLVTDRFLKKSWVCPKQKWLVIIFSWKLQLWVTPQCLFPSRPISKARTKWSPPQLKHSMGLPWTKMARLRLHCNTSETFWNPETSWNNIQRMGTIGTRLWNVQNKANRSLSPALPLPLPLLPSGQSRAMCSPHTVQILSVLSVTVRQLNWLHPWSVEKCVWTWWDVIGSLVMPPHCQHSIGPCTGRQW